MTEFGNSSISDRAMAFDMGKIVTRYAEDYDLPLEVARDHERELKRFLSLCAMNPDRTYGMKGPVDDLWHTFIIFTKDYELFCEDVAGEFLHHVPTNRSNRSDNGSYTLMLTDYKKAFNESPPVHIWPAPIKSDAMLSDCVGNCSSSACSSNCGCDAACSQ